MSETTQPDAVTKVARDLSEIVALSAALEDQAVHKATDREIPGGAAMVALGPVASPEAWENVFEAREALGRDISHVKYEDDEFAPPLQLLLFWSEQLRVEHNRESDRTPTIASEAEFIRGALDWLWMNEPHFEDFAEDVNKARRRLEDVLYAGRRAQRVRVHCNAEGCERKPRLIVAHGATAVDDRYKCPACKRIYDDDAFSRAYATQLRSAGAERFVKIADAVGTLRAQGRSERTIRQWFADCLVQGYCDPVTHEVFAWWPDLWRLHLTTPQRRRSAA